MNKVHVDDVRYTSLYKDYLRMRENGDKMTYIVAVLAKRYRIGERKVYTLCHRFSLRCDTDDHNAVFLIDPPYLSTEVGTYTMSWGLSDYLNVLRTLVGTRYIYFTSNKSSIIELCEWMGNNQWLGNPFAGCERKEFNAHMNYSSAYTDIMLYN